MIRNHENSFKGFTLLSKAWYGESSLKNSDYEDSISFGFFTPDGSTTGDITIEWVFIGGELTPKLRVYNDAWSALSNFHDLIDLLGTHDSEVVTPEQFCEYLLECGFVDITDTVNPYK